MKTTTRRIFFWLMILYSGLAGAKMAPPSPPAENPHPPATVEDKKRVAFAEQAVEALLKKDLPTSLERSKPGQTPQGFSDKDLSCLRDAGCYDKDAAFVNELLSLRTTFGKAVEAKHAHIIPWSFEKFLGTSRNKAAAEEPPPASTMYRAGARPVLGPQPKDDEYMVHVYVRFDRSGDWHHVDAILTEDKAGNVFLRHFFIMPMQSEMPPGVVC